jgi:uncharacterized protein DUF6624
MARKDRVARVAAIKPGASQKKIEKVIDLDARNTARMKQIVSRYGWPGRSLVGEEGADAAWLLVQHADRDLAFQKECLAKLQAAFRAGEASGQNVAFLEDRIAVAEGRLQTYGTQFQGKGAELAPAPIEDQAHVDERRKSVGLNSMAEYEKEMLDAYVGRPRPRRCRGRLSSSLCP